MHRSALLGTIFFASVAVSAAEAEEAPDVVASILPLGSIAAAVMDGTGAPIVLLEPGASPHAYSLRPTQAQALNEADVIFWVGPDLETFLSRPLAALGGEARQVALAEVSGIERLPFREGALFEAHGHDEAQDNHAHDDHDHDHGGHDHGGMDPHIWLSPANARVMAEAMAATLAEVDPAHAQAYTANAERFADRLDAVEAEIEAILAPVRGRPFVVFHDGFHYFEEAFGLEAAGAINVNPEVPPGAARVAEIQARIGELEAACVFAEPQFQPRVVQTVIEGSDARSGVLDPLGGEGSLGPDGYPAMLLSLASSLADCLGNSSDRL